MGPRVRGDDLPGGVAAICHPAEWEAKRHHLSATYPIIILSSIAGYDFTVCMGTLVELSRLSNRTDECICILASLHTSTQVGNRIS